MTSLETCTTLNVRLFAFLQSAVLIWTNLTTLGLVFNCNVFVFSCIVLSTVMLILLALVTAYLGCFAC